MTLKATLIVAALTALSTPAYADTLRVGPGQTFSRPCDAIAAAASEDVVEIDAAGTYSGDVCSISQSNIIIRGVNGRPVIDAAGLNAEGKGLWVTKGDNITIENVELRGATTPGNSAGIRAEGPNLTIRNSAFFNNGNGILAANISTMNITIENSEFGFNGDGSGQTHNVNIGTINRLVFRGNWSHDANLGHALRSRARENNVLYNRIDSKIGGTGSLEMDFPSGGTTYVIGNIIHQSTLASNDNLISYGTEDLAHSFNDLYVVNNTFVNERSVGTFVLIENTTTPAILRNNAFLAGGTITNQESAIRQGNFSGSTSVVRDVATLDICPAVGSPLIDRGVNPGSSSQGFSLRPTFEYVHPRSLRVRSTIGAALDAGACEATVIQVPVPVPTATPSPTPRPSPSPTVTPRPSPSPSPSVTPRPSPSPSPSPSVTPRPSPSPSPSVTPRPSPSPSPSVTPRPSPSPSPSVTPRPSPSPSPSVTPRPSPSPSPSVTPRPSPSPSPSPSPTVTPRPSPSPSPSPSPTVTVTPLPTPSPLVSPTPRPTPPPLPSPVPFPSPTPRPLPVPPEPLPSPLPPTELSAVDASVRYPSQELWSFVDDSFLRSMN